jgi:hypothetical protein
MFNYTNMTEFIVSSHEFMNALINEALANIEC